MEDLPDSKAVNMAVPQDSQVSTAVRQADSRGRVRRAGSVTARAE